MNLNNSYNVEVEKAYIIRIKDNNVSETLAQRCANSCEVVGQNYAFWDAYDGYKNPIKVPAQHSDVLNLVKVTDHYLTRGEVACALSHISLWNHCAQIEQPIVILEHDAIMLKAYKSHSLYNSICYLGSVEQKKSGWPVFLTPPHGSDGHNYLFICRAHAYAIEPCVARNMLAYVIKFGICTSLDRLLRADIFTIHQTGVYAYDEDGETTILNRVTDGKVMQRNDNLAI